MGRHIFNLEGGDDLTNLEACWFASYSYYKYIDTKHLNWKLITTYKNRQNVYNRTQKYHKYWLNEILKMNVANLNKNHFELNGFEIKRMAKRRYQAVHKMILEQWYEDHPYRKAFEKD